MVDVCVLGDGLSVTLAIGKHAFVHNMSITQLRGPLYVSIANSTSTTATVASKTISGRFRIALYTIQENFLHTELMKVKTIV